MFFTFNKQHKLKQLNKLKGDPGLDGRDGLDGEPGLNGTPGRDGLPGRNGQAGSNGIPGEILTRARECGSSTSHLQFGINDHHNTLLKRSIIHMLTDVYVLTLLSLSAPLQLLLTDDREKWD